MIENRSLILLLLLLLLFNSCQGQNKKDVQVCNDESNVIKIISKLDEVIKSQNYIDSLTKHKRGLSYLFENDNIKGNDCFRVKVGFNGKDHLETYYIFYVNKKNCTDIYINETVSGDIMTISQWRSVKNNNSKVNKKMKTKQEYFEDLFNESSNIEFSYDEINKDKLEIIELKRKLKLFEDQSPNEDDFNFDNLRILINNEVFTNSERFINSSWLEYFIKKYNVDVKKLTYLFNLAIMQEDYDAIRILIKYRYITSSKELSSIDDRLKYFKSLNGKIDIDEYYDPSYSKIEMIQKLVFQKFNSNMINDSDGYTNLRKGKGKESETLQKITNGEIIQVLDNTGNWFLIKTKDGNQGYVYKTKIKAK